MVEPSWYIPILPTVLINGTEGIGTGWSTNIPCYNPREVADAIIDKINGIEFKELMPWYKGFLGDIEVNPKGGFNIKGKFNRIDA